jgi:phosphopantothenoylcysteine decarboxylase/phosphopantothenate--cysteine ligase
MGLALAEAARDRGAAVTLVAAGVTMATPYGIERVDVRTTQEMADAVTRAAEECDAVIMAAAPADFRSASAADQKIKRGEGAITIELAPNVDIIGSLRGDYVKVGFAAETQKLTEHAHQKVLSKNLDLIVGNDVTQPGAGFATDTNRVVLIDRSGTVEELPLMSKNEVADRVLDRVARLLRERA